jgi:uncharacterized protein YcfJ
VGTDAAALPKSGHGNDAEAEWKGAGARLLTELEVMQVTHCPVSTIASNSLVHAQPAMFAGLKDTAAYISAVGARCRLDIISRDMQKGHWYYFKRTRSHAIIQTADHMIGYSIARAYAKRHNMEMLCTTCTAFPLANVCFGCFL